MRRNRLPSFGGCGTGSQSLLTKPGEALPSIRALAAELLVSVITVKRAYEDLEREGIIYSRQGLGTFVSESGAEQTQLLQRQSVRESLRAAIGAGRESGMTDKDILDLLKKELS